MTRLVFFTILIGIISIAVYTPGADKKSVSEGLSLYTIQTTNDTVWLWFGDISVAVQVSSVTGTDTSRLSFAHDLILIAGNDTLTIPPASEPAGVRMISDTDTALAVFQFMKEEIDTTKVGLLFRYSTYDHSEPPGEIWFRYSSPADSDLASLRTIYFLDSIAGSGDEVGRLRNLMRWVHNRLRHDGTVNLPDPDPFTSVNVLSVAEKEKRPFHCGILAMVLKDVYLSMGFRSRHLCCLPFDTLDGDSHSVVMVWSNEIGRWLLMDPTFEAYFTDTTGATLSPTQIRKAMAQGDSILVAESINWNGQQRSKVEYYNYMAKNLFRMLCAARWSSAENETSRPVYVYLIPVGYGVNVPGTVDSTSSEGLIQYYTANAEWFFAEPR